MSTHFRGGMSELMRQASRLQRKIEQRKKELHSEVVEAGAGNDQVKVKVNGAKELVSIEIAPELLKGEDLSMVQDLVVAAVNAGMKKANEVVDAELEKVTGGLKIPGLF
ncbi:YbaB/EbfC family nucleoid-associated protein [Sandaracinus amylolyticus]|uniref:YbaB/EbfC family nucleoid-associated protein n=1 Tax=Sandaracinus amylolyticus TaxID=927083 RepID=UPI001EFF6875|nr:YbaB/EbfC family nucleoid-associated protein [Sandaracinus amylolyticus]UJR79550.1 Nucleoid-associated protein, YbaB/EbfC family [Sandaracinus amylolyticus]